MKIRPLADRVLVLPAPAEEKVGGIIIPDTAKEKPLHGQIVATGNGTKDEEMILKEGDEVLVKVVGIDRTGKIRLSRKEALGQQPDQVLNMR